MIHKLINKQTIEFGYLKTRRGKKLKWSIINLLLFITADLPHSRSEGFIYSIFKKKANHNRPISLTSPRPEVERKKNQYVKKPGENTTPAKTLLQLKNQNRSFTNLESERLHQSPMAPPPMAPPRPAHTLTPNSRPIVTQNYPMPINSTTQNNNNLENNAQSPSSTTTSTQQQCKEELLGQNELQHSFICGLNFRQIFAKK
jgi:hypothetical protein